MCVFVTTVSIALKVRKDCSLTDVTIVEEKSHCIKVKYSGYFYYDFLKTKIIPAMIENIPNIAMADIALPKMM